MGIPKRHHYVPQFYLNYFVPETGYFWVYDKEGGPPREQTPINTAVKTRLYTIETSEGEKSSHLETEFSELETAAKPVLDALQMPGARAQAEQILQIVDFLALMYSRVPRTLQLSTELREAKSIAELKHWAADEQRFRRDWESFCAEREEPVRLSYEDVRDATLNLDTQDRFRIEPSQELALADTLRHGGVVREVLSEMNWCLCVAPANAFFITGDSPLTAFVPTPDGQAIFGAGLALNEAEVHFPISPRVALLARWSSTQKRRRISSAVLNDLNRRTAFMAERFIISPMKTDRVQRWVEEAAHTYKSPKIDRDHLIRKHLHKLQQEEG